ncbi:S9 family peptidase, partial [Arsukibacterium sp.]|uniref:alpha/beta hydrolase family protein n=1 Tax=Arsukibacterium sp. TaxID=1977258 RepID=UPI00299DCBC2
SGEALQLPELPAGDLRSVSFSDDSKYMSFYLNADNSPSNLYVWQLGTAQAKRLTQALASSIDEAHLVQSEVVRFNSFDGLTIPALLYKPHQAAATAKVPALIWIHGGPGGQSRTGYSPMIQHLVNHGYAVLSVNNRGSSGYGKTFFHLDDLRHGEDDLQDIVYGKKYLQSLDWVAAERIGVIGGSYGGYLTMAAMAFTDEFEVGINIFGVTNWVRTLESIPPWWEAFRESLYAELGDPAVDGERLRRISPVFHGDKVQKPVLVVQGANDPRVLQVESDEMVAAIRANNVPVEYVLFDDEGHGFLKKSNRIKAQKAYLAFLEQHL